MQSAFAVAESSNAPMIDPAVMRDAVTLCDRNTARLARLIKLEQSRSEAMMQRSRFDTEIQSLRRRLNSERTILREAICDSEPFFSGTGTIAVGSSKGGSSARETWKETIEAAQAESELLQAALAETALSAEQLRLCAEVLKTKGDRLDLILAQESEVTRSQHEYLITDCQRALQAVHAREQYIEPLYRKSEATLARLNELEQDHHTAALVFQQQMQEIETTSRFQYERERTFWDVRLERAEAEAQRLILLDELQTRRDNPASRPSRIAEYLLYLFLSAADRESLPGDLEEEYWTSVYPKFGGTQAKLWYWKQVLASVAPVVGHWAKRVLRWLAAASSIAALTEVVKRLRLW